MLAKLLLNLSAWFLLSVIVGLLVGRAISTFREASAPGFTPPPETDWEPAALSELGEAEMQDFGACTDGRDWMRITFDTISMTGLEQD